MELFTVKSECILCMLCLHIVKGLRYLSLSQAPTKISGETSLLTSQKTLQRLGDVAYFFQLIPRASVKVET